MWLAGAQSGRTADVGFHCVGEAPDTIIIIVRADGAAIGEIQCYVSAHGVDGVHIFVGGGKQTAAIVIPPAFAHSTGLGCGQARGIGVESIR